MTSQAICFPSGKQSASASCLSCSMPQLLDMACFHARPFEGSHTAPAGLLTQLEDSSLGWLMLGIESGIFCPARKVRWTLEWPYLFQGCRASVVYRSRRVQAGRRRGRGVEKNIVSQSRAAPVKGESSVSILGPMCQLILTLSVAFTFIENTDVTPFISGLLEEPHSFRVPADYAQHLRGWRTKLCF